MVLKMKSPATSPVYMMERRRTVPTTSESALSTDSVSEIQCGLDTIQTDTLASLPAGGDRERASEEGTKGGKSSYEVCSRRCTVL